jgi:nitroreductase
MPELDVFEAMRTTRAVRKLRPDPIADAVLARVLEAATWAPSGGNRQPWRIVALRSAETKSVLQQLYAALWRGYSEAQHKAMAALPESARTRGTRSLAAGDYLAEHLHEAPVILVFCFDPKLLAITDAKLGRASIVGGASVYPAVQNLLLACRTHGLGCVLTTLLCQVEAQVRPLIGLPDDWGTAAFVPIGYPVGRGHGAPVSRQPISEMVYAERFGERWFQSGE